MSQPTGSIKSKEGSLIIEKEKILKDGVIALEVFHKVRKYGWARNTKSSYLISTAGPDGIVTEMFSALDNFNNK